MVGGVQVERQLRTAPAPHPLAGATVVGVDRGVKTLAVVADADGVQRLELPTSRALRDQARRLAHAQRTVARRTVRGKDSSKNRVKAVKKVGRLHVRVATRRADMLHAFTAKLTRQHPTLVLETLTTKNLMANHHLAGAIGDQGWGELARQVTYKAAWRGGTVLVAPRFFPSSKTCSGCGAVKHKLPLNVRLYRCERCDLVLDRDVNAAATLAAWGEHQQGTCPCLGGSRVRDRHPGGRSDADPPSVGGLPRHACGGWVSGSATAVAVPVLPDEAGTSPSRTRVA